MNALNITSSSTIAANFTTLEGCLIVIADKNTDFTLDTREATVPVSPYGIFWRVDRRAVIQLKIVICSTKIIRVRFI
jgi:uncharacterized protein (DUF2141 family)